MSQIRFAIDQAFREEGIRIPFPQRDEHFFAGDAAFKPDQIKGQQP
jgi:small-conductance mechanosensitive channel